MSNEVSAARAAIITDRNERTIRRHIADGSLKARKTHRGWRIEVEELRRLFGLPGTPPLAPVQHLVQRREPEQVTAIVQEGATGERFATHADAARWLVAHGLNSEHTPKSWPGWRSTPPTERAILALALSFLTTPNHRITWRLRRCTINTCVCREMLEQ